MGANFEAGLLSQHHEHLNMAGKAENKGVKNDLIDDDDSSVGGSLCSESSWDPEETDPLELEIEREEKEEAEGIKMNKKNMKSNKNDKGGSEIN